MLQPQRRNYANKQGGEKKSTEHLQAGQSGFLCSLHQCPSEVSLKRRTFQLLTAEVHIQSYHSKCWKLINSSAFFYMVSAYLLSCSQTFRSYPRAGTSSIAVGICSEHLLKCFPLELHCLKKIQFSWLLSGGLGSVAGAGSVSSALTGGSFEIQQQTFPRPNLFMATCFILSVLVHMVRYL